MSSSSSSSSSPFPPTALLREDIGVAKWVITPPCLKESLKGGAFTGGRGGLLLPLVEREVKGCSWGVVEVDEGGEGEGKLGYEDVLLKVLVEEEVGGEATGRGGILSAAVATPDCTGIIGEEAGEGVGQEEGEHWGSSWEEEEGERFEGVGGVSSSIGSFEIRDNFWYLTPLNCFTGLPLLIFKHHYQPKWKNKWS